MTTHSFARSLARSADPLVRARLDDLYRRHFPGFLRAVTPSSPSTGDVILHLRVPGGSVKVAIEEKVQGYQNPWYELVVERLSNTERGTAGWVYYESADYICYAWRAGAFALLLPMQPFCRWAALSMTAFRQNRSRNEGYTTTFHVVDIRHPSFRAFAEAHGAAYLGDWPDEAPRSGRLFA